jgi:putative membrane protein
MKRRNAAIGIVLTAGVLLAVGLVLGCLFWNRGYLGYGPGAMMHGYYGGGLPLGMHSAGGSWLAVLLGGALIGGLVLLLAGITRRSERPAAGESPLEIVKRRYASGEIDRDEFVRIKEALANSSKDRMEVA